MLGAEGITSHDYPRGCQAMGPGSGILAGGWARGLGSEKEEEEPGGDRGDGGHPHVANIGGRPGGGPRETEDCDNEEREGKEMIAALFTLKNSTTQIREFHLIQ